MRIDSATTYYYNPENNRNDVLYSAETSAIHCVHSVHSVCGVYAVSSPFNTTATEFIYTVN